MAAEKVLHMNGGDGETSYANNSGFQKAGMSKSRPVLDETLEDMFSNEHVHEFPKCFKMVDLGCSSGPNTLLSMSHIMDKIGDLWKQKNIINNDNLPEFEVFLNDLPGNDFNNLFKLLQEKNGRYFVYGLPGSFYNRLFPQNTINFAYACYSVHWLSQVPQELGNKNGENVYLAMTSPPEVHELYVNQYKRDFNTFLSLRAAEIISGGRMVLIFIGRSVEDPSAKDDWSTFKVLSETLAEMVPEGLVKMDDLYSFNMPVYAACMQEVEAAIQTEGSFTLDKSDSYRLYWKSNAAHADDQPNPLIVDNHMGGKMAADFMRAILEPMLATHFGTSVIDDLFVRYTKNFVKHLSRVNASTFHIVISLTRK